MEGSLFFIGKRIGEREWEITRKPDFYDAILLTHQSPQTMKAGELRYQRIPLPSANIIFNLRDHNIHFNWDNQKHQIVMEGSELTEEEVTDAFKSLLFKQGTMVSYIVHMPKGKTCPIKKEKTRLLAEAKKLTQDENK